MRILHISDFHYQAKNDSDYRTRVENLCNDLVDKGIDMIVFSGDLVFEGGQLNTFKEASKVLFDEILKATGLGKNRLVITQGNHDMERNAEINSITKDLDSFMTMKALTDFCNNARSVELSFDNSKHYNDFIDDYYHGIDIHCNKFCNWRIQNFNNLRIGVLSINSAWRCKKSETDRGNLLMYVPKINDAIYQLRNCDLVLVTMHHRLSDYKDFVETELANVIYERCHLLLTGHYHRATMGTSCYGDMGILLSSAPAIYNRNDPGSEYGYRIIDVAKEDNELKAFETTYHFVGGSFLSHKTKSIPMPMAIEKRELNDFRKNMVRLYSEAEVKADDLFVSDKLYEDVEGLTFRSLYVTPIISDTSEAESAASGKKGNLYDENKIVDANKNFVVFGQNKGGKTSLLWKIYLDLLKSYHTKKILPYFINYKEYSNGKPLDLIRSIRNKLQMNTAKTEALLNEYKLLLLVDDIKYTDDRFITDLEQSLKGLSNYNIVACAEDSISANFEPEIFKSIDVAKLYIHEITRKEIHQLTKKWPKLKGDKLTIEEQIISLFNQLHIPYNYWTTSLFLWILEKTDSSKIRNNFELVSIYIDEILGQKHIIESRGKELKIEYKDLQSYLGALAECMYNHPEEVYSLSYQELIDFTEIHSQKNRKFPTDYEPIISTLLSNRVIVNENGRYSFRLKGVFEFFLALKMSEDETFRDGIMNNNHLYLSFGNEIELYAGFKRKDSQFVQKVIEKTEHILKPLMEDPRYTDIDSQFAEQIKQISAVVNAAKKLAVKMMDLTDIDKEDVSMALSAPAPIESSKVEVKLIHNIDAPTPADLEKAVFIACRVYRNSDICDDPVYGGKMLDYLLTACCKLAFIFVESVKKDFKGDNELTEMAKTIYNFLPIVVQSFFFDAISQFNLGRVFEEKLNELEKNPRGNLFRIFILLFTLLDLDMKVYKDRLGDVDKFMPKGVFRFSSFTKLLILVYRNSESDELIKPFKELAVKLKSEMWDKDNEERDDFINKFTKQIEQDKIMKQNVRKASANDFRIGNKEE